MVPKVGYLDKATTVLSFSRVSAMNDACVRPWVRAVVREYNDATKRKQEKWTRKLKNKTDSARLIPHSEKKKKKKEKKKEKKTFRKHFPITLQVTKGAAPPYWIYLSDFNSDFYTEVLKVFNFVSN